MMVQLRRKYNPDFIRYAVRLSEESGRIIVEIVSHLCVARNILRSWRDQHLA